MPQQSISKKENKMGTMPVPRLVISMSTPIMFSMLVQALYNIVDSIFVSMQSEMALTAVSLAFPIQNLLISVAVGTSVGMNSLLSRKLGSKEQVLAEKCANNGLTLAFISWGVFAVLGLLFSRKFYTLFTDDSQLLSMCASYTMICLVISLGMFIDIMCERIMQATGDTIHPMIVQITGAVTNIILDPIMIFGLFGFPKLGVTGAAVATVIGQHVSCLLALHFVRKNPEVQIRRKYLPLEKETVKGIYAVGVPSIIMQSIGTLMTTGFNKIIIAYGTSAVAVFGVYFKLQSFVFMPIFGLNSGMIPVMGYNYGARKPRRIIQTQKTGMKISLTIMAIGFIIFFLFPHTLLSWFNASEEMYRIGEIALRRISFCFVFAGFSITLMSLFQAIGDGYLSMIISVTRQLVVLLPAAYLLSRFWGLDAVWYAFIIAEISSFILTIIFYRMEYLRKIKPLETKGK